MVSSLKGAPRFMKATSGAESGWPPLEGGGGHPEGFAALFAVVVQGHLGWSLAVSWAGQGRALGDR